MLRGRLSISRKLTIAPENDRALAVAVDAYSRLASKDKAYEEKYIAMLQKLLAADPTNTAPVPVDLVTASASGLDPQISPAAADYQVARVARARKLPEEAVRKLVQQYTKAGAWMGILGDATVNVLELNLALDKLSAAGH